MRHGLKFNHLKRQAGHRKALLSHLACDLIKNKRIVTTLAKAKALRVYVEPLITKSKTNTTHQRRIVFSYLQDKQVVGELFGDVSAKIGNRPGGYTRIIKLGARLGDATEMAMIELVDYNELYSSEPVSKQKKRRTRRGGRSRAKKPSAEMTSKQEQSQESSSEEPKKEERAEDVDAAGKNEENKKEEKPPLDTAEKESAPLEDKKEDDTSSADGEKDKKTKE